MNITDLKEAISEARETHGITKTAVAREAGYDRKTAWDYLSDWYDEPVHPRFIRSMGEALKRLKRRAPRKEAAA